MVFASVVQQSSGFECVVGEHVARLGIGKLPPARLTSNSKQIQFNQTSSALDHFRNCIGGNVGCTQSLTVSPCNPMTPCSSRTERRPMGIRVGADFINVPNILPDPL